MLPVTWWMHIGISAREKVLVCGDLDRHSIEMLAQRSNRLYLYDCAFETAASHPGIETTGRDRLAQQRYDAIIVNQAGLAREFDAAELERLSGHALTTTGVLCCYEYEACPWRRLAGWLADRGIRARGGGKAAWGGSDFALRYRAISYKPRPYEAFASGRYHNNKNVFLAKERVKRAALRSWLAGFIANSSLWIVRRSARASSLIEEVHAAIERLEIPWRGSSINVIKIMYRPGKIIFSLNSEPGSRPEYVAVIAFDEISRAQRDNEAIAIEYFKNQPALASLVSAHHLTAPLGDFKLYLMSEIEGITVDIDNRDLARMTRNAFATIVRIDEESLRPGRGSALRRLATAYLESLFERFTDHHAQLAPIRDFLATVDFDALPMVFMHGDAKLENFVLDDAYDVIGVIDFELAEIDGFPLLDVFYLIVYNQLMIHNKRFDIALQKLVDDELAQHELELVETYSRRFVIDARQQAILKLLFFVHHYARRYWVTVKYSESWHVFDRALGIANRLCRRLDESADTTVDADAAVGTPARN